MTDKARRSSNLELLRILCMLMIVSDHLAGQSGIGLTDTLPHAAMYAVMGSGSRIACNVLIVISAWFLCVQPFKARRLVSLWLGLWLYTVPLTVLCRFLPGCEVGLGTLRWAMFPISTAQLWFLSAYFALMLCAPLLNTVLHHALPAALTAFLTAAGVLMAGYSTLFGEDGALSSSLFAFVWLYLFTGYLRLHPGCRADALLCRRGVQLALGLGIPAALTAARTLALWQGAPERVSRYLEYWRTALGAAPNLLAALGLVLAVCLLFQYSYMAAFGSAMKAQKEYETYLATSIAHDVNLINADHSYHTLSFAGGAPVSVETQMIEKKFPFVREILPVYFTNTSWGGASWMYRFTQYELEITALTDSDCIAVTGTPMLCTARYYCYVNGDKILVQFQ